MLKLIIIQWYINDQGRKDHKTNSIFRVIENKYYIVFCLTKMVELLTVICLDYTELLE